MGGIMKYVAYKTAQNDPNLPNGFITEHFSTDKEIVEGYIVAPLEVFNAIFQNNIALIRQSEVAKGITTVNPGTPAPVLRPASDAEHVPANFVPEGQNSPDPANTELFSQFLAWVAAGKPGTPSNT